MDIHLDSSSLGEISLVVKKVALAVNVPQRRVARCRPVEQGLGRVLHHEVVRHRKRLEGRASRQNRRKHQPTRVHYAVLVIMIDKREMEGIELGEKLANSGWLVGWLHPLRSVQ